MTPKNIPIIALLSAQSNVIDLTFSEITIRNNLRQQRTKISLEMSVWA